MRARKGAALDALREQAVKGALEMQGRPGRKVERYILPSYRVAGFVRPNVGEYMELRSNAERQAVRDNQDRATFSDWGYHLTHDGLRKLLVALSHAPVPVIYRAGFDVKQAESDLMVVTERARAEWPGPGAFHEPNYEEQLADVKFMAEDVEAMRATANLSPVTDYMWEEDESSYLQTMPKSELGTVEALDWHALHQITTSILSECVAALQGGKLLGGEKKAARTASWR